LFGLTLPGSSTIGSPSILALLVGTGVTTQAPSSNRNTSSINNNNSKKKFKNSKPKENLTLSTLSNRK
jgi:hypothetical protein